MTPTPEEWLGQLLQTESNQPHEWPAIAWVVRNRVEARNQWASTYAGTILWPRQFSHYNDLHHLEDPALIFERVAERYPERADACACAAHVMAAPRWEAPFGPKVYYYYSPVSMKPAGRAPPWNWAILRPFTLAGIDPWRFVFAEDVHSSHPQAGDPPTLTA